MKFCALCNNMLVTNIQNEELLFKCMFCNETFEALPEDTLRFEISKKSNIGIVEHVLKNAQYDETNLKAFIDCPKCKYHIAKQIELADLKLYNICDQCGYKSLYNN